MAIGPQLGHIISAKSIAWTEDTSTISSWNQTLGFGMYKSI